MDLTTSQAVVGSTLQASKWKTYPASLGSLREKPSDQQNDSNEGLTTAGGLEQCGETSVEPRGLEPANNEVVEQAGARGETGGEGPVDLEPDPVVSCGTGTSEGGGLDSCVGVNTGSEIPVTTWQFNPETVEGHSRGLATAGCPVVDVGGGSNSWGEGFGSGCHRLDAVQPGPGLDLTRLGSVAPPAENPETISGEGTDLELESPVKALVLDVTG